MNELKKLLVLFRLGIELLQRGLVMNLNLDLRLLYNFQNLNRELNHSIRLQNWPQKSLVVQINALRISIFLYLGSRIFASRTRNTKAAK